MRGAYYMGSAILFEVFGSTMLKLSSGFTLLWPSLGVIFGFFCSFTCFGFALRFIPLSTAYAIWAGMGTALTACVGWLVFHEVMTPLKVLALLIIITGIAVLNMSKSPRE